MFYGRSLQGADETSAMLIQLLFKERAPGDCLVRGYASESPLR